tara:strand:+ start:460 stop:714 length:255 start_codon:yes stop_codon:yes gene_type:complete
MGATTKRIFYEEVIKLLKESGPMVMRDILPAIKERRPISTLKSMSSNRAGQLMRQCKDIEAVDKVRVETHSGKAMLWAVVGDEE